jgi:hypothetical protein
MMSTAVLCADENASFRLNYQSVGVSHFPVTVGMHVRRLTVSCSAVTASRIHSVRTACAS